MTRRYSHTIQTEPVITTQPREPNPLSQRAIGAVLIGVAITILVLLLLLLIISLANPHTTLTWSQLREAGTIALVMGTITTATLIIRWTWEAITKPSSIDDRERNRRWTFEDEDRDQRQAISDQMAVPRTQAPDGARIHLCAFTILQRHAAGLTTTRTKCVQAGTCTQAEWNDVSHAFKTIGWKPGNKLLAPPDLNQSWPYWEARTTLDPHGQLWAQRKEGGNVLIA